MLDIIVNPLAGGKNGKKMDKSLSKVENYLKERKIPYAIHKTEYKSHGTILTKELISRGARNIIAMGGDGTLHEVINGFSDFDRVTLGIIPCGTGNDFAYAINLPKDVIKSLEVIIKGEAKYTDFIQLPTVRCLNVAGMGIDVDVLNRYEKLKKKTKFGYTKCLIKSLFKFDRINYTASYNEKVENASSYIACVANGVCIGGGLKVCPTADVSDGLLDFINVKKMKGFRLLGALLKLKSGKILSLQECIHNKTKKIEISTNSPYFVNVDGEIYKDIPFSAEIITNTLRIYR